MPLKFNGAWRFKPPPDGRFVNAAIPDDAVEEVLALINKVATQGSRQTILEHFKAHFCEAYGVSHSWSSSVSWAETDLWTHTHEAASNAPLFIEAFYDACKSIDDAESGASAPDVAMINELLARHGIGYCIKQSELELRDNAAPTVAVENPPPTLAKQAAEKLKASAERSHELLAIGKGREAVQESLWLLETGSTAFRGLKTGTTTIEGRYFNQIAKELKRGAKGTTLELVLGWMTQLHGFLSSPTGGGIRHGLDLHEGVEISDNEARLFCNLIHSYLWYLLLEYERLSGRKPRDLEQAFEAEVEGWEL